MGKREEKIMDSGLCVLKGFVGMLEIGIYGRVLVNKFRNWKTFIYGYEINVHYFKISEHDCLSGHWNGVDFDVFFVKAPNHNIIMMSTKYGLMVCEVTKMNNKYQKERCTNYSMHNPFIVTTCVEEIWKIIILCVLTKKYQYVGLENAWITYR